MSIDRYHGKVYNKKTYNCLHFSTEVWADLTGDRLPMFDGQITLSYVRRFRELSTPVSPCLVIMRRPKLPPHIGVYIRGRVLHLQERGVEFQPVDIASVGFKTVRYATTQHPARSN